MHSVRKLKVAFLVLLVSLSANVTADSTIANDTKQYIEDNLLAIFYHELGHALIDLQGLPVFGQEEDAADVLSALLIDQFYSNDDAIGIAYNAGQSFLLDAEELAQQKQDFPYWDTHGHDLQRYYNMACLVYGGAPQEREEVIELFDLPEERAEGCEEEYLLAIESWGPILDDLEDGAPAQTIQLNKLGSEAKDAEHGLLIYQLLESEVAALNTQFQLNQTLEVKVALCGEANAFYDLQEKSVTMCTEYADLLQVQHNSF